MLRLDLSGMINLDLCSNCDNTEINKVHDIAIGVEGGSTCSWLKRVEAGNFPGWPEYGIPGYQIGVEFNYTLEIQIGNNGYLTIEGEDSCDLGKPYYVRVIFRNSIGAPGCEFTVHSIVMFRQCYASRIDCLSLDTVVPWIWNSGGSDLPWLPPDPETGCDGTGATAIVRAI